eukprot:6751467-Pyramimonas_sp.AAC.1
MPASWSSSSVWVSYTLVSSPSHLSSVLCPCPSFRSTPMIGVPLAPTPSPRERVQEVISCTVDRCPESAAWRLHVPGAETAIIIRKSSDISMALVGPVKDMRLYVAGRAAPCSVSDMRK